MVNEPEDEEDVDLSEEVSRGCLERHLEIPGGLDSGQLSRLDRYLASVWNDCSRARIQSWVKDGHLLINGKQARASDSLKPGDQVRLLEPRPISPGLISQDLPLTVLYEDTHLLVLNKSPGMSVHPGAGQPDGTLVNALLHHCPDLSGIGGVERPGIVHRLDKETSGCLVVAKNDNAHRDLSAQFAGRTVLKVYLAGVHGVPRSGSGRIDAAIGRHPVARKKMHVLSTGAKGGESGGRGRHAVTDYRVLLEEDRSAWVACRLHTGRTHQIRVHLLHLGHPLLGDPVYAVKKVAGIERLMLHAWLLGFHHPVSHKWMEISAAIPEDFPVHNSEALPTVIDGKHVSNWFGSFDPPPARLQGAGS